MLLQNLMTARQVEAWVQHPDNAERHFELINERELRHQRIKHEIYHKAGATVWEIYAEDALVGIFTPAGRYRTERQTLNFEGLPELEIPLNRIFV